MKIIFCPARLKFLLASLLVLCFLGWHISALTAADKKEADLTPNLTVNIKLNSALGDKETEFYSKIAQDIINKLPRELLVNKDLIPTLDAFNEAHKHVNVVTYLPVTEGDNAEKRIQHFKIKFILDENGASSSSEIVDQTPDETVPHEEREGHPPLAPAPTLTALPIPETTFEEGANVAVTPPELAENLAEKQAEEAPAQPAKTPEAPQPVAEAPSIALQTKATTKITPQPIAPVAVAKAQKATQAVDLPLGQVVLRYEADDTALSLDQRAQVMAMVYKVRTLKKPVAGFTFVVRAFHGPQGAETWLSEERLQFVTALLRQQDIDVSRGRVTEIFVTTDKSQLIEIYPIQ